MYSRRVQRFEAQNQPVVLCENRCFLARKPRENNATLTDFGSGATLDDFVDRRELWILDVWEDLSSPAGASKNAYSIWENVVLRLSQTLTVLCIG
jgi:hypothetical protein